MADEPIDLSAARGARIANDPDELCPNCRTPIEALEAALHEARTGKPIHVVIIFAMADDDGDLGATAYRQAGSYDRHGQLGMVAQAQHMMANVR